MARLILSFILLRLLYFQWYTYSVTSPNGGQTFDIDFFANRGINIDFVDVHYMVSFAAHLYRHSQTDL
jgi:hypothetical protein